MSTRSHSRSAAFGLLCTLALVGLALAASASAADAPALSLTSLATPTNFAPGDETVDYNYDIRVANFGAAATDGTPITITDTLPAGLTVKSVSLELRTQPGKGHNYGPPAEGICKVDKPAASEVVTCTLPETMSEATTLSPAEERQLVIHVIPKEVEEGEILTNQVTVSGGGSAPAAISTDNEASSEFASAGISFWHASLSEADGQSATNAGSHPYQTNFGFAFHTKPAPPGNVIDFVPAGGDIKDIRVPLPAGLSGGSAVRAPRCTAQQFVTTHPIILGNAFFSANACPDDTAVGVALLQQIEGIPGIAPIPLYNLVPPPGMPAQFGFQLLGLPFYIDTEVSPEDGYRVVGVARNLTQIKRLTAASVILWGTPLDKRHDPLRGSCVNEIENFPITMPDCEPLNAPEADWRPLLRLPTNCDSPLDIEFAFDSWTTPGAFLTATDPGLILSGCNQLDFDATFSARPTTDVADSPSGLTTSFHLPQEAHEDPKGTGEADLRHIDIDFPKGLVINPAAANGLDACSPAQVGLKSAPGQVPLFNNAPAQCPDAARLGTVETTTPVLDHPLKGAIYAATPFQNPFGTLLATYITLNDPQSGIVAKLAGSLQADPNTGQLTASFKDLPQVPLEDVDVSLFNGPYAPLRTPATCATYTTASLLTPWSAPESGPAKEALDSYPITQAPGGGACATTEAALPFAPSFSAGSVAPIAAAHTPFVVHLRREDGSQELQSLATTLPPGLLAKLAGVPCCPESSLATAAANTGRKEQASPSCPPASQLGSATAGAGAGPAPYYTTGKVYLGCTPYKGAPVSAAVITPAVAGPFDLGTVLIRAALYINPETFQATVKADPLPRLLQGIPLDVRTVDVNIDRPNFILNPTSCDEMAVEGTATSFLGASAPLHNRFQVGECGRLKFAPKISLRLKGGTRRGAHPSLRTTLTYPQGGNYANVARVSVALPHSEFLDTTHIGTVCTRVQFAANACPPASIYGHAIGTSPLVDYAVEGPVYLRSSNHPLPDLVFALHGPPSQPVQANIVARIDSVHGGTRATVDSVPDVPISKFTLTMPGGKKGLLQNSRNICATKNRATVKFDAQNGKVSDSRPLLRAKCPKGKRRSAKR